MFVKMLRQQWIPQSSSPSSIGWQILQFYLVLIPIRR